MLRRAALLDTFDDQPDSVIAALRDNAVSSGMHWPDLYALAEMNYLQGDPDQVENTVAGCCALRVRRAVSCRRCRQTRARTAAQFGQAANIYNLALTQVFSGTGAEGVDHAARAAATSCRSAPSTLTIDPSNLKFAGRTMTSFVPTMNLQVKGFKNDYRSDGIGAPIAAGLAPAPHRTRPRAAAEPAHANHGGAVVENPRQQLAGASLDGAA